MSLRTRFATLLIVLLTGACNISTERPQATPLPPALGTASASRPVVTITAPANGTEVVVGTDILIKGQASDAQGVTRVQLIANDRIVRTVSSESSSGLRTMEVTLDYRPVVTGTLNLEVVAWRGSVPGDPASVSVTVRANRSQVLSTTVARPEVPVIDPNDPTCRVLTNVALNVRVNAGTGFDRITTLPDGRQAPVIGRLADNSWWQVSLRDGTAGWVAQHDPGNPAEQFISIYGDCTLIPALAPPQPTVTSGEVTPAPAVATAAPVDSGGSGDSGNTGNEGADRPDLIIASLRGPDSLTLTRGGNPVDRNFELTISNQGKASSGQFSVTLSGVPETGTIDQVVSGLGPGESISFSHSLSFSDPEQVILVATVDSDGEVEESDETNNSARLDVTISRN